MPIVCVSWRNSYGDDNTSTLSSKIGSQNKEETKEDTKEATGGQMLLVNLFHRLHTIC